MDETLIGQFYIVRFSDSRRGGAGVVWNPEFLEFYAHGKIHLDNSCLPYVSDGFTSFLLTGTKSWTNAVPKRSKSLTFENCLNVIAFWHSNYRDNEDLSNRGFVVALHLLSANTKTRWDKFHLCCISNISTRQFYGRNANSWKMQHKLNLSKRVSVSSLNECRAKTKPPLDKSSLSR